jgi:ribosome-binding protein aMBF1 (putative translation factor)
MIRSDAEYQEALRRLSKEENLLSEQRIQLKQSGLSREELKRAMDPLESFHAQLREEVESYERLKLGETQELRNLHGLGRTLVASRIALGISQRELAKRLNVHESQVSRDERNEYHGISVERASRILDALGVECRSAIVLQKV